MIDIHSHILPGIDDGARDIYDTLEMAHVAAESGVRAMVATPHCNLTGLYRNYFSDEYIRIFESTVEMLKKEAIPLTLYPGMEVFATPDLPDLLVDKKIMPLNQSRYVLIEFDFQEEPGFTMNLLQRVSEVGARPIIAHAERYTFVQDDPQIVYEWRKNGYQVQVNKGSILGNFGSQAEETALELLAHKLVTVIASDAHGPRKRTPYMRDVYEELRNYCSYQQINLLFNENPLRICNNQPVLIQQPLPFR